MRVRIHVNQHIIRNNKLTGSRDHPLTVKTYKTNTRASSVEIQDKEGNTVATIKYQPEKPLACGASVWVETDLQVVYN